MKKNGEICVSEILLFFFFIPFVNDVHPVSMTSVLRENAQCQYCQYRLGHVETFEKYS